MILNFKQLLVKNYVIPHYGIIISHSVQTNNLKNLIKLEAINISLSKLLNANIFLSSIFDIYLLYYSITYFEDYFNKFKLKNLMNIEKSIIFIIGCFIIEKVLKGLGLDIFLIFFLYHIPKNHKKYVIKMGRYRDFVLDLFLNVFLMSLANGIYQEYPLILSNSIFIILCKGLFLTYMMYNKIYIE